MPAPEGGEPADTMRALEREVMLQLIDQKWREHLSEMDYLREGHQPAGHGPAGSRWWPGSATATRCSGS